MASRPTDEFDTKINNGRTFVAVSGDGKLLISRGMADRANIQIWDVAKRAKVREFDEPDSKFTVAASEDGKLAAWATDTEVVVCRTADGHLSRTRVMGPDYLGPHFVRFSKNGTTLFVVGGRRIVGMDPVTGKKRFEWHPEPKVEKGPHLEGLSNTFDRNRKIASGDEFGDIKVWDVSTGKVLKELKGAKKERLCALAATEDGNTLISLTVSGPAYIWDLPTGQVRRTIGDAGIWGCLTILPDQKSVLLPARSVFLGGKQEKSRHDIHLVDIDSATVRRVFTGHEASIWAIAMTEDGSRFFSSGDETTIKVWKLKSP